jgi:hypothetical protein
MSNPHKLKLGEKILVPAAYLRGRSMDGKVTFVQGEAKMQPGGRGCGSS